MSLSWRCSSVSVRAKERAGKEPLLSTSLFHNRTSNLGLVTQNTQWLLLMGTSFVVSAYLQVVRGYDAIQTGVIFTAATAGLLASSLAAERLAKRYAQRTLIVAGFVLTIAGVGVLLVDRQGFADRLGIRARSAPHRPRSRPDAYAVGQRRAVELPGAPQGEISGLSRSVSNLGSASAPLSPARSSLPASPRHLSAPTDSRWRLSQ